MRFHMETVLWPHFSHDQQTLRQHPAHPSNLSIASHSMGEMVINHTRASNLMPSSRYSAQSSRPTFAVHHAMLHATLPSNPASLVRDQRDPSQSLCGQFSDERHRESLCSDHNVWIL